MLRQASGRNPWKIWWLPLAAAAKLPPAFGYDTYRTAFSNELYYYERQMGITHPDFTRLAKVLE